MNIETLKQIAAREPVMVRAIVGAALVAVVAAFDIDIDALPFGLDVTSIEVAVLGWLGISARKAVTPA